MTSLLDDVAGLEQAVAALSSNLHKHLSHSSGATTLSIMSNGQPQPVTDVDELSLMTTTLGRIHGTLEQAIK
jgi:hypothetical protein